MKYLSFILFVFPFQLMAQNSHLEDATLPLEEENRSGATILAVNSEGNYILAKRGSNAYICLADDPNKEGFSVSCYHKELDAFMDRGRQLKAEGKSFQEIFDIREAEVKSGDLYMPKSGSTLYVMNGKTKEEANLRWVFYIPFATAESTGLPLKPMVPGGPWIMDPGTHRAHIMITPVN